MLKWRIIVVTVVIAFCLHSVSSELIEYTPQKPFRFAQQIFWDSRTNIAVFTDTSAFTSDPTIFQFDWETRTLYSSKVISNDIPTFCVPTASDPDLLVCSFFTCVSYVSLPRLSPTATRGEDIACRSESDLGGIDRGATISDGTLIVSLIPENYCDTSGPHPSAAASYVDLKSNSLLNAVFPGFYSNGFSYDSKTNTLFIAHDCLPGIVAYHYYPSKKAFVFSRVVYRFSAPENFPSGLALDTCGNLYVGEHNSGKVYYIDTKRGKLLKTIEVPGTHVTAVAIVGPKLNYLSVITSTEYHDAYGNNRSNSTDPGDGKMYLIPLAKSCCHGKAGTPVAIV